MKPPEKKALVKREDPNELRSKVRKGARKKNMEPVKALSEFQEIDSFCWKAQNLWTHWPIVSYWPIVLEKKQPLLTLKISFQGGKKRRRNLFGEFNFDQVDSLSDLTLLYQLVVFVFGSKFLTFEAQKVVGIYINFLALRIFFIKNLWFGQYPVGCEQILLKYTWKNNLVVTLLCKKFKKLIYLNYQCIGFFLLHTIFCLLQFRRKY